MLDDFLPICPRIRHVYLDLDTKGDEALEAIRNSPAVPAPNFVLDISPGKHQVVWKVSGFSQDEAESLLHNLGNQFGGDLAATDSTRVPRLAGFASRKLSEEFIVQARQESDAVYTLRDFTIDEDSPEAPRHIGDYRQRERGLPSDHKSQSEHDWGYAKRALARGDDPDEIIRRIADHRSEGPWACLRAVPPLLGFSRSPPFRGSSRDRSLVSRRAEDASNRGSGKK